MSLPTARGYGAVMQLIPSLTTQASFTPGARDVQVTPGMQVFGGQGGRENEGRLQVDGIGTGAPVNGGGVSGYIADVTNAQEVAFTTSGGLGEAEVGGPTMTIVPKTGGNTDQGHGSTRPASATAWSAATTRPSLQAAGLSVPGRAAQAVGLQPRRRRTDRQGSAVVLRQRPQRRQPSVGARHVRQHERRRSDQAHLRAHLTRQSVTAGLADRQPAADDPGRRRATSSACSGTSRSPCNGATWSADIDGCRQQPASGLDHRRRHRRRTFGRRPAARRRRHDGGYAHGQRVQQATWSSPVDQPLLIEAGFGTYLRRRAATNMPGNPDARHGARDRAVHGGMRRSTAASPNLIFRSQDWVQNWNGAITGTRRASYVTGAHSMKFGYQGAVHRRTAERFHATTSQLAYRVNNGVPNQLT